MFQAGEGIPRKAATFGVGRVLLCPGDTQAHHGAFDFRRNILQKVAHTSSVLGRVTSSTGLFGEVTGRNARSITGLEKSGKILCCRANLQVKMMSVK